MENSGKIFFEDDTPQWYVAIGEKWIGPLTATDLYEKILQQELTWAHFIWRRGQSEWKRVCDIKTFQALVPHAPAKAVQKNVIDAVKPVVKQGSRKTKSGPPPAPGKESSLEARTWYLYYNDSQFGPFSTEEIRRFIKIGRIHGRVHAWQEGMSNWDRLERIGKFQEDLKVPRRASETRQRPEDVILEQRSNPRRPLVAKILMADDQSVIVGVCRDISVGGLQVLTERVPGKVGARLKMNISPSSQDPEGKIQPLVAEGVIVRILEDGRGFSFRFERLTDRAKQTIEAYIESSN